MHDAPGLARGLHGLDGRADDVGQIDVVRTSRMRPVRGTRRLEQVVDHARLRHGMPLDRGQRLRLALVGQRALGDHPRVALNRRQRRPQLARHAWSGISRVGLHRGIGVGARPPQVR